MKATEIKMVEKEDGGMEPLVLLRIGTKQYLFVSGVGGRKVAEKARLHFANRESTKTTLKTQCSCCQGH